MAREGFNNKRDNREREISPIETKTIAIRRVAKVVKGGRTQRFSALVVAGNKATHEVGVGLGKALEVPAAMEKAGADAKKNMFKVALVGSTIPHVIIGTFGRGRVVMMPAEEGTGVIAGGAVRQVLEAAGIKDIRTKSLGTNNAVNSARATIEGLKQLRTPDMVAKLRGKNSAKDILDEEDYKIYKARMSSENNVGTAADKDEE